MYQELRKNLGLPKFLKETEEQMMAVFREEWTKIYFKNPDQNKDPIKQVQEIEM